MASGRAKQLHHLHVLSEKSKRPEDGMTYQYDYKAAVSPKN